MTTTRRPSSRSIGLVLVLVLMTACSGLLIPTPAVGQDLPARQVVMFGVLATPGSKFMDPKISPVVAARLRRTLPGHGFKLIQVKSARIVNGQSVGLDLGDGYVSTAQLISPMDLNGKVQMRFDLSVDGASQFQSIVTTPADQFNYFDKMLPDDSHLLIGVGAR
jgi:hypothetical protein